jgi:type I restriction enzyme S subunit
MGGVATVVGGGTPSTGEPANFDAGDIPWITPADLSGYREKRISRGARNITVRGLANSGAKLMPAGSVLLSSRAPIGYVAIAAKPLCTNQGFKSFVLPTDLESDYVYYYLLRARELALGLASGTTFLEISAAKASLIPLALAPLAEQRRIVTRIEEQFTRLDAAVAALKRIQANLKRYRASVLKAACEGRLVPTEAELARREGRDYETGAQLLARNLMERRTAWGMQATNGRKKKYVEPQGPDASDLAELPEGWIWASVEQLGIVQLGRQRSPKNRSKDHPVQYLRAANVTENGLDLSDLYDMEFSPDEQQRYRLRNGDLVLSEASGSADQVGKPAVWRDQLSNCCFQNTVIRLRPVLDISDYLLVCFLSYYTRGVFARAAGGVGINHLSAERFSRVSVPLPPIEEQHRIVVETQRCLSISAELGSGLDAGLKRAERLRQAILKRAFEGKLVPQDPNDEPASGLLERIRMAKSEKQVTGPQPGPRKRPGKSR